MKRILFSVVGVVALIIISLNSCKKDDTYPVISSSSFPPPNPQEVNLELVANHWVNYGGEVYVNTFSGVIAPANTNGNHKVLVYLHENGTLTEISQHPVTYLGNELSASRGWSDVTIMYRTNKPLPFTDLNIRIEVR